ncbi:lysophospholipid acyltransferase [Pseudomonas sp. G11-1]|uniref:Lysophospholipid acyltransferase n=1 Tax=Halopseudomonas bauzanensis TaxID=653930 RepID=A0A4U0YN23_9GAMM|nr:lysophospholipid acyltransferase [Halopseudomonas bauzanensis]MCO5786933.1 lysophospholipid acyltransferase [Pseudomonas sp. G11-1]MCO5790159.1 lysophospholipid acyltransferase [Pseudomonas sp. G11-2]TKA92825.1 lysophospholipid acyltransferase [Halopseudomonas bauzanensis]
MKRLKGAITVGFLKLFALLPFGVAQRLGAAVGWLMWKLPNRSRDVVRINFAHCLPELPPAERERLVGETLVNIGRSFAESACAWMWSPQKTVALIKEVEGEQLLDEALAEGKGLVGITSHLGNWEVLNHWYCLKCSPIIFYRPPKQKAVDELLQKQRTQLGNKVAASTREGIISVMREVRRGGAVGIPADPEPALKSGLFVPFFGIQALTSKFVPGLLKGGAANGVFLHCVRLPDHSGFKVIVERAPAALYSEDETEAVAAMSACIENYVRRWPSQYMWSMKRFKKRPAGERKWY